MDVNNVFQDSLTLNIGKAIFPLLERSLLNQTVNGKFVLTLCNYKNFVSPFFNHNGPQGGKQNTLSKLKKISNCSKFV